MYSVHHEVTNSILCYAVCMEMELVVARHGAVCAVSVIPPIGVPCNTCYCVSSSLE